MARFLNEHHYNNNMKTPNYPFLSGWLQSNIRRLAVDKEFINMNEEQRIIFVEKMIEEAKEEAINYNN